MAYSIDKFDGTTLTVVQDGTINTTLDIKLVGKDYPGYGETQNENFVFMLENFAGTSPPPRPMNGQLWYDTSSKKIKFYDKVSLKWKASSGSEVSATPPAGQVVGDLWFDETNQQLLVRNSTNEYLVVGPQSVTGYGLTQVRSRKVIDMSGNPHPIVEVLVDGVATMVVNEGAAITLDSIHEPFLTTANRFHYLRAGVNLAFTNDDGVSNSVYRFNGTATNADRLGGNLASDYVTTQSASFPNSGITIGNSTDFHLWISSVTTNPTLQNDVGSIIDFSVRNIGNTATVTPLRISENTVVPSITGGTDLGTNTLQFGNIWATEFHGNADTATALLVAGTPRIANVVTSSNTIAVRDNVGSINALEFKGVATSAKFADLAEKYVTDKEYEAGTVIMIGGEFEVTESQIGFRAIGAISANPAFKMNSEADGQYVALKGRVPVRVTGPVNKGDELVAWADGAAIVSQHSFIKTFAIALETNLNDGVKLVEAVIL